MKKRLLSFCLVLALCAGLTVPTAAEMAAPQKAPSGASAFTDVSPDAGYADAVEWAVENGITTGRTATAFAPDEACTRAQLATFLWRAAGCPEPALTEQQFMDVTDPGAYYYKAVQWAAEKDMEYYGTFWPHEPCDRLEAAYFLWRAAGSPETEGEMPFTDVPWQESEHGGQPRYLQAKDAVLWAVEQGIAQGRTATTFAPEETCTRAQIVTFLYRAFA